MEEGRERHCSGIPPTPRKHLYSLSPPIDPGPLRFHLVLPLALVALSFAPLDLFSPDRFSGWCSGTDPKQPHLTKVPPLPPLLCPFSNLTFLFSGTESFDSPPSSPPSP